MPFFSDRAAEEWTGNGGDREEMTSCKGPQGGIEPVTTAARYSLYTQGAYFIDSATRGPQIFFFNFMVYHFLLLNKPIVPT